MYKIHSDFIYSQKSDKVLTIINVTSDDNCYYSITGIAADVFLGIFKGESTENLVKKISTQYKVQEARVQTDMEAFLKFLLENKIAYKS